MAQALTLDIVFIQAVSISATSAARNLQTHANPAIFPRAQQANVLQSMDPVSIISLSRAVQPLYDTR